MDVDKLIRINSLSKELQRHGITNNSIDSLDQARIVVEQRQEQQPEIESSVESSQGTVLVLQSSIGLNTSSGASSGIGPSEVKMSALQERRVELLLEMNAKKYEQEIQRLRAENSALQSSMEQLRLEVKTSNERNLQSTMKKAEQQAVLKTEPKELHPRQGNFKSEDVSIEKMFYFGAGGIKR